MASNTDIQLRSQVIYSIYVRAHTEEGTFNAIHADLDRIKALGVDIIWFMPIHPIGIKGKKGSLGCPYANRDYRTVNPEYGTMADFRRLVDAIHEKGMKCIIDVVYNHTSPDSTLVREHPEFFYRKPDGSMGNHVGDWTDVVDLDYRVPELWDYQIESLKLWASIVDGFRCDVASMVDVAFWCKARAAVEEVRPGCIWLAETVEGSFAQENRRMGLYTGTDCEMYRAFDMEYDYDIWGVFRRYLTGQGHLSNYADALNFQECQYPGNFIKMRCLENHDQPRICSYINDETELENITAMLYFLKGSTLLYAGQEFCCDHTPSLFEKEVFPRTGRDLSNLLAKLNRMKKELLSPEDAAQYDADDDSHILICRRTDGKTDKLGVFSLKGKPATVSVPFPDGSYTNHLDGQPVTVSGGQLCCHGDPVILSRNA